MASVEVSPTASDGPKKLRRITRACDYCHKRSIRCRFPGDTDETRCQNCIDFNQPCTFERVAKRRGAKPRTAVSSESTPPYGQDVEDGNPTPSISGSSRQRKPSQIAPQAHVVDLVEIFFEVIYPIFPLFHRPSFRHCIARGEYMKDRFKFSATMAVCALVTARIADRALFNPRSDIGRLSQIPTEVFYAAAVRECSNVTSHPQADFDLLRTYAILALTALQYGNIREMQSHLGQYHILVAMDLLHDEDNWPETGIIEREERRRVFWSMYTLDIYSSIIWDGVARSREQQSNVQYTSEVDDDYFDDTGYRDRSDYSVTLNRASWLQGWNFITDLYRLLEHVTTQPRTRRKNKRPLISEIFPDQTFSASNAREAILSMYNTLPPCFKDTPEITYDQDRDRYGFQAATINATVQFLRMALLSNTGASVADRCNIGSEVVGSFMQIPAPYLHALSSPLLYQIAGIGTILGSVLDAGPVMSEQEYYQVRVVLLALAQLLENLDQGVHPTDSAVKMRGIVGRLDAQVQRRGNPSVVLPSNYAKTAPPPASAFSLPAVRDGYDANLRATQHAPGGHSQGTLPYSVPVSNDVRQWPPPWGYDFMQFPEN